MGLVLDSSVLIDAERSKRPVGALLTSLASEYAEDALLLSSITVMELEHGWRRAVNQAIADVRRAYLDELFAVIPIEPFTREMAVVAARVDADCKVNGVVIPTADLLIGSTALRLGYSVGTANVRHFRMIPGLDVVVL